MPWLWGPSKTSGSKPKAKPKAKPKKAPKRTYGSIRATTRKRNYDAAIKEAGG